MYFEYLTEAKFEMEADWCKIDELEIKTEDSVQFEVLYELIEQSEIKCNDETLRSMILTTELVKLVQAKIVSGVSDLTIKRRVRILYVVNFVHP